MKSKRLNGLIEAVSVTTAETDLQNILKKTARSWGFDHFVYLLLAGTRSYAVSSYPKEWQDLYLRRSYFQIDPVIKHARTKSRLYTWSLPELEKNASRPKAQFLHEAMSFGITSGVSIPVPAGYGKIALLTFASGQPAVDVDTSDPVRASAAAALVHAQFAFVRATPTMTAIPKLTPRQALCLKWSSEGKTMDEIAEILDISTLSVRFHLDEARTRLDAVNLIQASTIAAKHNLL
ncbi:autoinducer binding domain-containing protein [Neorhizobium alkalisoli]|uniref:LuxR family transcriptional activator of conjugal transfer of Ti plasmids n=1 Tax=Neorhizobium alkalisoli TaxID=528178 RepID=A0A561PZE6_9HYPH|nr:autoinducer binding domain-containing protein [Neorhizobium alkalisoli]TWF43439.1 LuxR family transcriptional activator of conjugal transfer of Ti plasmids [Neorhizobium alkalisoli]